MSLRLLSAAVNPTTWLPNNSTWPAALSLKAFQPLSISGCCGLIFTAYLYVEPDCAEASCGNSTPLNALFVVGNAPCSPRVTMGSVTGWPGVHLWRPVPSGPAPTPAGSAKTSIINCGAGALEPPVPKYEVSQFVRLASPSNNWKFAFPLALPSVKLNPIVIATAARVVSSLPATTSIFASSTTHVGRQLVVSTGGAACIDPPRLSHTAATTTNPPASAPNLPAAVFKIKLTMISFSPLVFRHALWPV